MSDPAPRVPSAAARDALLAWYAANRRALPWRETTDPYEILVAEVMSQQTQLGRVVPAWEAFLDRWPTATALAEAAPGDVIAFWSDHRLGYNRRAEYLHTAAEQICEEWDGDLPDDPATLETLKGVGPYTANAVASFAFNNGGAVVDTNVKRVLYRVCDGDDPEAFPYAAVADQFMPDGESRQWNNAIMELGAMVCQPTPLCDDEACPVREWCTAYATGDFTAPDVPSQPSFDGSRRQFRGRVVRAVSEHGPTPLDTLGPRVRVDFDPSDADDLSWLRGVVEDLADDGLVQLETRGDATIVRPRSE